jgi:hypothetical protein
MNSTEYAKALEIARQASQKYGEAQKAYHSRLIGDSEFLAARAEYVASDVAFDAAFAAEEVR